MGLYPAHVVRVHVARPVGGADLLPEALLDQLQRARVDGLAALVTDHEEGRPLDAEALAEDHARALGVVLVGPHHLVDTVPEAARLEVSGHVGALAAVRAVGHLLLDHADAHGPFLARPPAVDEGLGVGRAARPWRAVLRPPTRRAGCASARRAGARPRARRSARCAAGARGPRAPPCAS